MAHFHYKKLHHFSGFQNNIAPYCYPISAAKRQYNKYPWRTVKPKLLRKNGLKGIINRKGVKALYQPKAIQNVNIMLSIIISKTFSAKYNAQKSL